MKEIIRIYNEGLKDGIKDALLKQEHKKFKYINTKKILSKIYNIAYINGYKYILKIITLNNKKNSV